MKHLMRISAKKLGVILCIIAISVSGLVFAAISSLNKSLTNTQITDVFTDESAASKVTIYGNGVTFINYEGNIEVHEDGTFQFYLPSGALTDTLKVLGISVAKITTSQEYHPIIETNDIITVYTEDAVYTGKFLGWDDMLLLEANNGTVMIPAGRITKIVLTEVVQTQGPKTLVTVTTDSPPGEYQLKISYLMRGPSWKSTYFVDVETSRLECWATIENVENWQNFTLALVTGGPHIVYSGPFYSSYNAEIQFFLGSGSRLSPSIDFTSTTTDEYHEYTYGTRLSFEKGTVVKLPLFEGTVTLRQEYFWYNGEVQNRYHINNTLTEPLASGIVEFYRGQAWLGEESIPYTPVKGESIAIVNYAYDIKVTTSMTKSIDESHHWVRGMDITIRNHKATSIQILIEQGINGYTLITSTPPATRVGGTLSWTIDVNADSTFTIYYEWEHYW